MNKEEILKTAKELIEILSTDPTALQELEKSIKGVHKPLDSDPGQSTAGSLARIGETEGAKREIKRVSQEAKGVKPNLPEDSDRKASIIESLKEHWVPRFLRKEEIVKLESLNKFIPGGKIYTQMMNRAAKGKMGRSDQGQAVLNASTLDKPGIFGSKKKYEAEKSKYMDQAKGIAKERISKLKSMPKPNLPKAEICECGKPSCPKCKKSMIKEELGKDFKPKFLKDKK